MDLLAILSAVFTPASLMWILIGALAGIVVGVIPGLTATVAIALLVPMTLDLDPLHSMLMLTGIFAGSMYSNSITSITLRTPGNPSGAVTIIDGYPLALKGQAGRAIGLAAYASAVGGVFSVLVLWLFSPMLASVALRFSPVEYFAVGILGLTTAVAISGGSRARALTAVTFGLVVGVIGTDPLTNLPRFTFGQSELRLGVPFLAAIIGVFAMAEVLRLAGVPGRKTRVVSSIGRVMPTRPDMRRTLRPVLRGSVLGTIVGILPGGGGSMASYLAYGDAKRKSKHPEEFGKGSIEGVAAPDAANSGMTGGAMVPLLTLGIPGDATTAVMLGALIIQGINPGPRLFESSGSDLVYPLFAGMLLANVAMVIMGLALAKPLASVALLPRTVLLPAIATLSFTGAFIATGQTYLLWITLIFGVIGYLMVRYDYPVAALALGLILGPILESNLRRGLMLNNDDPTVFLTRPISAGILGLAVLLLALSLFSTWRAKRRAAQQSSIPA
ncbi:tripartite tricarboxylate transporter permease [Bogoriella caseilytica]|uniref:Putative tricarboxylic transport membrane protein n=1 Tax=Bogoriella caseilytica TaxID=56055 RepID=A0A3N2BCY0_9MICO|nr:tripartite tricarboxylate transporter permease [Bogoriella caseilytica]ROR73095.1 putative tricarboxylic transport membrane protein [Bogoriella caseilytica]